MTANLYIYATTTSSLGTTSRHSPPPPLPLGPQVAICDQWRKILLVTFVAATWCSGFYLINVWINSFTTGEPPCARYIPMH